MTIDRCRRYSRDGTPCRNATSYLDAWCRQDGCDGFIRAYPDLEQSSTGSYQGSERQIREAAPAELDLQIDEIDEVRITEAALEAFRSVHGGGRRTAEAQLRYMLEDFLNRGTQVRRGGTVQLARKGFTLVLSDSGFVVLGYRSAHRDRTWEQVKRGIPSRISHQRAPGDGAPGPEAGPAVPLEDFAAAIDPRTIHLTGRALKSYARLRDLRESPDLEDRLRAELATDVATKALAARAGLPLVDLDGPELVWLLRGDAAAVIGVRRHRDVARSKVA